MTTAVLCTDGSDSRASRWRPAVRPATTDKVIVVTVVDEVTRCLPQMAAATPGDTSPRSSDAPEGRSDGEAIGSAAEGLGFDGVEAASRVDPSGVVLFADDASATSWERGARSAQAGDPRVGVYVVRTPCPVIAPQTPPAQGDDLVV